VTKATGGTATETAGSRGAARPLPPAAEDRYRHEVLGVVLSVRDGRLHVLLWRRALPPFEGHWPLPCGPLGAGERLGTSASRHLAAKVDITETGFREITTYLRGSMRALRGTGPDTARQELWAYLIAYQALGLIVCQAALAADLDPGQISFTAARDAVQDAIATTPRRAKARTELIGRDLARRLITKHVICRTCPRMVKRPLFHFPSRQASTELASQNVTYRLSVTAPATTITKPPEQHQQAPPPRHEAQPRAA
jgi:ADP-ribose pyrophosphatase YjhB (NUDIX family)